jgi:hypothetical protein
MVTRAREITPPWRCGRASGAETLGSGRLSAARQGELRRTVSGKGTDADMVVETIH